MPPIRWSQGARTATASSASYELKGKELEFKNLGMTRMACPDMQYEDAFVKMLDDVDRFEIKGSELTFFDDDKVAGRVQGR